MITIGGMRDGPPWPKKKYFKKAFRRFWPFYEVFKLFDIVDLGDLLKSCGPFFCLAHSDHFDFVKMKKVVFVSHDNLLCLHDSLLCLKMFLFLLN